MKCCHGHSGAFACNGLCQKPWRFEPFFFVSGGEIKAPLSLDLLPVPCLQAVGVAPARQTATTAVHKCRQALLLLSCYHHQKSQSTSCVKVNFNLVQETDSNNNQEMLVSLGPNPSDPSFPLCVEFMRKVEVSGRSGSRLLSLAAESESHDYFGAKVQINLLRGCDLADLNQMRSAL